VGDTQGDTHCCVYTREWNPEESKEKWETIPVGSVLWVWEFLNRDYNDAARIARPKF
jgi:hypothetical protein